MLTSKVRKFVVQMTQSSSFSLIRSATATSPKFMDTIATKVFHQGNYTLDHCLGGHGDSSCLLADSNIAVISSFDLVFVQSVA